MILRDHEPAVGSGRKELRMGQRQRVVIDEERGRSRRAVEPRGNFQVVRPQRRLGKQITVDGPLDLVRREASLGDCR